MRTYGLSSALLVITSVVIAMCTHPAMAKEFHHRLMLPSAQANAEGVAIRRL